MIIITGTIKVETEDEFTRVKDALVRRAKRSREDEGNIDYVFSQNLEDPTIIHLTEKWKNDTVLNAHLQIPDEEFGTILDTAKIERATVVSYEIAKERVLLER